MSSTTSISKQWTKQSIQGQLPVMALEFPFPPKRASSSTSICPPRLMHNVSSSSTRFQMAFSAAVLIRGMDDVIDNPMASLKGVSLAYQNGRSRCHRRCRRLFPISLVATSSSSSSSSSTSTTMDISLPSINSMALHSLGSEQRQFPRWESNVYLAHRYASSSLPLPLLPPSPAPPLWCQSIASPHVVVVPNGGTIAALAASSVVVVVIVVVQQVGDALQAHQSQAHPEMPLALLATAQRRRRRQRRQRRQGEGGSCAHGKQAKLVDQWQQ